MRELNGIWWAVNQKQVTGTLVITDENKISLRTYEKLNDTNIINGFADGQRITLVDIELEQVNEYSKSEEKIEYAKDVIEIKEARHYYIYTYVVNLVILGNDYVRKGDIRLESLQISYTNLDEWVDCKSELPVIEKTTEDVVLKFKRTGENRAKLDGFDVVVGNPYSLIQKKYIVEIKNEVNISVDNILNRYIESVKEIITCLQYFLVLCMGDNVNVTKIKAIDGYNNDVELILGYVKSNYENKLILKNIVKYNDIKDNFEEILSKWIELYNDNELLVANFVNLQRREEPTISEYTNLMSAIDNLFLVITKQNRTKESFVEILKRLFKEVNFVFELSEEEIDNIALCVKEFRRYFIHSNKTQRDFVVSRKNMLQNIICFLIELIRIGIMVEIGVNKKAIKDYYDSIKPFQNLKSKIIEIRSEIKSENENMDKGVSLMEDLSKENRENISELNAIYSTRYREVGYNLENTEDLIEAVQVTTAEYMDYYNYWQLLEYVAENFDESLEVFNPGKWMKNIKDGETGNELIDDTLNSIYDAEDNMGRLMMLAEEKCIEIWKFLLLGDNVKAKEFFLGKYEEYTEEQVIQALEELIDNISYIKHENVVVNDCKNFANELKLRLEKER